MIIKNRDVFQKNNLRQAALQILESGLESVSTKNAIKEAIRLEGEELVVHQKRFQLSPGGRVIVIGVGKCALESGRALEKILGDKLSGGAVLDVTEGKLDKLKVFQGTHPFPSTHNALATKELISLLPGLTEKDTVIFIISGGGSTLLCQPQNITCGDEADLLDVLFKKGASIKEINTLRKHLSSARGGYLAKYAYPAQVISFIFSDVPGDDIAVVASGPTIKDETTIIDAQKVVEQYDLDEKIPHLHDVLIETPKDDKYFEKVENILIVSNSRALRAMEEAALKLGFESHIVTSRLTGEARLVGKDIAHAISKQNKPTVILYGGETTVTISGKGIGGRNQELVLAALGVLNPQTLVISISSDGRDNSDHAGALCDIITKNTAHRKHIDPVEYLIDNNSYEFFERVGDYIQTGNTGINISDIILAIHE
ncbi:MAG: DUF4147 domain-containing protein [Anaplasmataceae bacterium]|nr:DUF4147 domain-containing protein [Anaplasmataceae bacterium]